MYFHGMYAELPSLSIPRTAPNSYLSLNPKVNESVSTSNATGLSKTKISICPSAFPAWAVIVAFPGLSGMNTLLTTLPAPTGDTVKSTFFKLKPTGV